MNIGFYLTEEAVRVLFVILAVFVTLLAPFEANAARGVVVYQKYSCDYYIVKANMGYALLEWYGDNTPREGDALVGNFESYGMKEIYNLTADSETRVWVEDYGLSREDAIEAYFEQCN